MRLAEERDAARAEKEVAEDAHAREVMRLASQLNAKLVSAADSEMAAAQKSSEVAARLAAVLVALELTPPELRLLEEQLVAPPAPLGTEHWPEAAERLGLSGVSPQGRATTGRAEAPLTDEQKATMEMALQQHEAAADGAGASPKATPQQKRPKRRPKSGPTPAA